MAKKKKTKKLRPRRQTMLKFRSCSPGHNLLVAASHWVKANGGNAVVLGGIGIMDEEKIFIEGHEGQYQVCIKCVGRKPTKEPVHHKIQTY
jgi:hypothetical protein